MSRALRALAVVAAATVPLAAVAAPSDAAGTVRAAVSLTSPASGTYGTVVPLTGILWRYGTSVRIANATVWLQRANHGSTAWSSISTTRTASNGTYRFGVTLSRPYDYRVVYAGSPVYTRAISNVRYPVVAQKVLLDGVRTVDPRLGTLTATGRVYPTPIRGTAIWLQRWDPASRVWRNLRSAPASGTSSAVSVTTTQPAGSATYRLVAVPSGPYAAAGSNALGFTHYVLRGAFKKGVIARGGTEQAYFRLHNEVYPDYLAETSAGGYQGDAWADVRAVGCTEWQVRLGNYGTAPIDATVTGEAGTLASMHLDPGDPDNPTEGNLTATVAGSDQVRITITNASPQGLEWARTWIYAYALCSD